MTQRTIVPHLSRLAQEIDPRAQVLHQLDLGYLLVMASGETTGLGTTFGLAKQSVLVWMRSERAKQRATP